jgi:hypothetical protein
MIQEMTASHSNLVELEEENRFLRQSISDAQRHLKIAVIKLNEKSVSEDTPMNIGVAIEAAANALANASRMRQSNDQETNSPIPDGPTRRQGQFLAYIREYMLRNQGLAPTHLEFQRFFQLTPPSVNSMLKRLDQKGFIRRVSGKPRAIQLTIDPEHIPKLDRPFKH